MATNKDNINVDRVKKKGQERIEKHAKPLTLGPINEIMRTICKNNPIVTRKCPFSQMATLAQKPTTTTRYYPHISRHSLSLSLSQPTQPNNLYTCIHIKREKGEQKGNKIKRRIRKRTNRDNRD